MRPWFIGTVLVYCRVVRDRSGIPGHPGTTVPVPFYKNLEIPIPVFKSETNRDQNAPLRMGKSAKIDHYFQGLVGKNYGKIKFSKPIFLKKCSKILIFLRRPLSGPPTQLQRNRELEIGNPKWGKPACAKLTLTLPSEIFFFIFTKNNPQIFGKDPKLL